MADTYNSAYTGPEIDAAAALAKDVQAARDESNANLAVVQQLAGQVDTNAQAANASKVAAAGSATAAQASATTAGQHAANADSARALAVVARNAAQAARDQAADYAANAQEIALGNVPDATPAVRGLMSATDKGKLDGVEAGAQVNAVIVNTLTSTATNQPLSAAQGRVLKGLIDTINAFLASDDSNLDELQEIVDFIKLNRADLDSLSIPSIAGLETALNAKADAASLGALAGKSSVNNADWSGTGLSVANGGTGASDAPGARSNLGIGSMATRDVIISTGDPSGGADGDIWLKVD